MIRRKLFAYTIMFTVGISAGFFIFEKTRLLSGVMLMITAAVSVCLLSMTDAAHRSEPSREAIILIAFMAAGFLIFTCRYCHYEKILLTGTAVSSDSSGSPEAIVSEGTFENTASEASSGQSSSPGKSEAASEGTFENAASEASSGQSSSPGKSEAASEGTLDNAVSDFSSELLFSHEKSEAAVSEGRSGTTVQTESPETTSDIAAAEDSYTHITGEVLSAEMKENGLRIVMRPHHGRCKVRISYYDDDQILPGDIVGREITAMGRYREPPGADNPGCFDYRTYLRSRGTGFLFTAKSIEVTGGAGGYRRHMYLIRERFLGQFGNEEIRGFIQGVVFGDKSRIDEAVLDDFNQNGTGHILAVSGLHTGFLYGLLKLLAGRRKTMGLSAGIILILLMYGEMTMWSPSTMRAVTVLSISLMSVYMRRPFDLLSSVSAAAFLMLAIEPYQLFSSGFQMSFMALLGIAFFAGPLTALIGEPLAVMIAVQLGVAPLTAFIFHRLNLLSIFINIPVIFLASVLVPLCMIGLVITILTGSGIGIMTYMIEGLTEITVGLNRAAADPGNFIETLRIRTGSLADILTRHAAAMTGDAGCFPVWITGTNATGHAAAMTGDAACFPASITASNAAGLTNQTTTIMEDAGSFSVSVTAMNAGVLILFYLVLMLVSSEWFRVQLLRKEYRGILYALALTAAVSACLIAATFNQFADDEIVFVSVGQGDCTHIRTVDTSPDSSTGPTSSTASSADVSMVYACNNVGSVNITALSSNNNTIYPYGDSGFKESTAPSSKNTRIDTYNNTGLTASNSLYSIINTGITGSGSTSAADNEKVSNNRTGMPGYSRKNILIDGGGSTERNIGKDTLMPYLLANGAGRVELALATHLHTDHFLGLLQLSRLFPVGAVGIPDDYRRSIEKAQSTYTVQAGSNADTIDDLLLQCSNLKYISPGSRITITDDIFIDTIWPLKGHERSSEIDDPNENNNVYIVNYRGTRIMVTGDLLEEDEKAMLDHYRKEELHCDILKVAHHGSKSSSCEEFLDAVSPSIAVIQVGKNNLYGHPHQQTLDRLEERGVKVYRTDLNGAVGIDIRKNHIIIDTLR